MSSPVATIRNYFEAINGEDWPLFATLWAPDAELIAVGAKPRKGREEIVIFYKKLFTPWSTHIDTPTRVLPSGDAVTVEVEFTGTTHDGREISFDAVDVFDLYQEKIVRLTNWYDLLHVRRLLEG